MSVGFGDLPATTYADWCRSDEYHNSFLIPHDEAVEAAMKNSASSGLLDIEVSRSHGKFLHLLARTINAKRVLEVGTLGGLVSFTPLEYYTPPATVVEHDSEADETAVVGT